MTPPRLSARRRRISRWGLAALWLAAFIGTHIPAERVPELHASDKILHAAGYAVLATALWLVLAADGIGRARRIAVALSVLIFYAAMDEATQPWVNRSASIADWLADGTGVVVAVAVWEAIASFRSRRRRSASPSSPRHEQSADGQ